MVKHADRSLWPLAVALTSGLLLGLAVYLVATRGPAQSRDGHGDRELRRFGQDEFKPASDAPADRPDNAPAIASPVPLEVSAPAEIADTDQILADAARDARKHAANILAGRENPKDKKPSAPTDINPPTPKQPRPEPVSIRPPAPEDAAAKIARETLSRACAALRRTRPGWIVKSYEAKWQATLIAADRKTAHVAFGGGKWPDCDVRLEFDALRQSWRVRSVQGGGFPPGLQW